MKARALNLMTMGVVSLRADSSLAEAARTLASHTFSALPVLDANDIPIGIVSETDLMRVLLAGVATSGTVSEFMTTPVEVIDEMVVADEARLECRWPLAL